MGRRRRRPLTRRPRADELDAVATFAAGLQVRPEQRTAGLGRTPAEIGVYLESWATPWHDKSRVADLDGALVGFAACEPDEKLGRAWIYGPLVAEDEWDAIADHLLTDVMAEAPPAIADFELSGDLANVRLAALAQRHGFAAGVPHFLLTLDATMIAPSAAGGVIPLPREHEHAFVALHDLLFPGTYYSGAQLLERAADGTQTVLALVADGELVGYAAGRLDEAGDGYVDFVGVEPAVRREGYGRALVLALCRTLGDDHPIGRVTLTVSSENGAALALYDDLGFRRESSSVGYRLRPDS